MGLVFSNTLEIKDKFTSTLNSFKNATKDSFSFFAKSQKQVDDTTQKAKKTLEEYRKDVMKLANEYKKAGMSMSEAMKKAYMYIAYRLSCLSSKVNHTYEYVLSELPHPHQSFIVFK